MMLGAHKVMLEARRVMLKHAGQCWSSQGGAGRCWVLPEESGAMAESPGCPCLGGGSSRRARWAATACGGAFVPHTLRSRGSHLLPLG